MTTVPFRTPCSASYVCTAHDYMLSMLSICRANSRVALRHLSVGAHLATRCLSQCLGWQELAALKHHATCFQALLGRSLCLPTLPFRPWRGITFCNKNLLVCITDFNAHYANILKPAPSKSQQTAGQAAETGQNLFERCIYAMLLLREKRVVLSPMLERTAVCGTIASEQCLRRREL